MHHHHHHHHHYHYLLLLLLLTPALSQHLENDLQSLLHRDADEGAEGGDDDFEVELLYRPDAEDPMLPSLPSLPSHSPGHPSHSPGQGASPAFVSPPAGVRRLWGVEDKQGFVGRVFSQAVPVDAFQGDVKEYKVKGLPAWLAWDGGRRVVEGVPRPSDRGHHYVTLRAWGADGSHAKDVFAIDVVDLPGSFVSKEGSCRGHTDVTMLSVLLDAHLSSLSASRRLSTLLAANKFMGRNASFIPAPYDSDPLAMDAALQAGPGSARLGGRRGTRSLAQLQWVVGCDGEVRPALQPALDHTEAAAKNGDLEKLLSLPVLGWHVTQMNPKSKRVRRQVEHSGDYGFSFDDYEDGGYDNYDYDGEYNYVDYVYGGEEEEGGDTLNFADYDAEPEPETRVIPSLATPSFPDLSTTLLPSPSSGPRPHHPDPSLHFSPVFISTPVYVPDKPTRVLEASPTVTYGSSYPTELPLPSLEPSVVTSSFAPTPVDTHSIAPSSVHTHTETESAVHNYGPRVKNRIPKLAWVAGHVYRQPIPRATFEDFEDGDTRDLRLELKTMVGHTLGYNSWIQLDPNTQEIYALPLEKHVGRYSYLLEATDSEGKSITDTIVIHVQQPREARNYNHLVTAEFITEKNDAFSFAHALDWQVLAVEKVAILYKDEDTDNINVRSISLNPTKLAWTNTSLTNPRSTVCPADELEAITEVVVGGEDGMSSEVKAAFRPQFQLTRIHVHYKGLCESLHHTKPALPRPPAPPKEKTEEGEDGGSFGNSEPVMRNPIDLLKATAGSLLRYQVPEDTCYDFEDGDSHKLKMRLLTTDLTPLPSDSWLQFDKANHEFFGVPLASNVGETAYYLECVDKGGLKVTDALFVKVEQRAEEGVMAAQFTLTLDHNFRAFMRDAHLKARLLERIAAAFGDEDARHVAVDQMAPGSVVVTWHNASLPGDPCPEEEVMRLRRLMMDADGHLLPAFVESFAPEYRVVGGRLVPAGVCLGGDTPTHAVEEEHKPPVEDDIRGDDNDYLVNFIIPAVIIAAMLLLAAVIACCLYRRRRYGKMTMADERTFVTKGIPIIFAEELDDRPDPAKSPVIMKEEKPPLPPPEYQRGSSPAASATPPDRRRPHSGADGGDDAPSYQPPPPFTATNGASRHPRPNMPPTYRKPPTYVPP